MNSNLTMTLIGADRPGLVQLVADRVAAHGGNWLESRMCRLGGQFAGIVRVEIPSSKAQGLAKDLAALEEQGLRAVIQAEGASRAAHGHGTLATVEIVGHDRPGIVREITAALARHRANVEEFSSECVDAPMGGPQLFQARITVLIPPSVKLPALRAELEKIAGDLMVDVSLSARVKA